MTAISQAQWAAWQARRRSSSSSSSTATSSTAGDRIGGLIVGSGEIADLDAKVQQLSTDVQQADLAPTVKVGLAIPIVEFVARWDAWRDVHTTFLAQSGVPNFESGMDAPKVGAEFQAFTSEYNEKRRQFLAAGGKTDAPPASTDSPLDKLTNLAGDVAFYGLLGLLAYLLLGRSS